MFLVLAVALVAGAPAPEVKLGLAPRLEQLRITGGRFVETVTICHPVNEARWVQGKKFTVTRMVPVTHEKAYAADKVRFMQATGKNISAAEARKLVGRGAMVVISSDGKPIDPRYLQALKPETLVIVPEKGAVSRREIHWR